MPPTPCQQCGTFIPQGSRFCPQCGASLGGSTPLSDASTDGPWEVILQRLREAALPRYQVRKLLGSGGMAGVYLADEPRLGRRVAIKVMSPGLMADPAQVDRFHQEARATARLSHPNIVTIHEIDDRGGLHYFVMSYVEGRTLGDVLSEARGPLPVPVVLRWFREITGALYHAHRLGIVHRDVKPGNILLDGDGNALVTDFGIAKVADEPGLTRTGMLVGTPTYMSPEQCLSTEITGAADQYSLGVLVYHMLTGSPPFSGGTMAVLQAHVGQQPEPILSRRADCPPELATLVERMMAKDPADRWPSLADVLGVLQEPETSTGISTGMRPAAGRPPVAPPPAGHGTPPTPTRTEAPAAAPGAPAPASTSSPPSRVPRGGRSSSPLGLVLGGLAVVALGILASVLFRGGGEPSSTLEQGTVAATSPAPSTPPDEGVVQGGDPQGPTSGTDVGEGEPGQGGEEGAAPSDAAPEDSPEEEAPPPGAGAVPGAEGPPTAAPAPPSPARITVVGDLPEGAQVTASGPSGTLGISPPGTDLPAGGWTLEFRAPGHIPQRETVTLEAGGRLTWTPTVVPETPATVSPEDAVPEPAGFDESSARAGVEATLGLFAAGFQSRDLENVIRQYPSSSEEWRGEWRVLVEDTRNFQGLEAEVGEVRHVSTSEGSAEVEFVLTLRYVDLRNRVQSQNLQFRGRLAAGSGGWTIVDLQNAP